MWLHLHHRRCLNWVEGLHGTLGGREGWALQIDQKGRCAVNPIPPPFSRVSCSEAPTAMWQGQDSSRFFFIRCSQTHPFLLFLSLHFGSPRFVNRRHYVPYRLTQTNVKKSIKKEEAEELKLRLEAAGGTVEIV